MSWGAMRRVAVVSLVATAAACASKSGIALKGKAPARREVPIYEVGACLAWTGRPAAPDSDVDPRVVPCAGPHRLQVTGDATGPPVGGGFYPAADAWDARIAVACHPPAVDLLGGPLDPSGRFDVGAIRPSRDEWRAGITTMWCGLEKASNDLTPGDLTGDARGADQTVRYPAGTCIIGPPASHVTRIAGCDKTHMIEIAGAVTYGDAEEAAALRFDSERCAATAASYLGGPPRPPWVVVTEPIGPASWDAGRRVAHCSLVQPATDGTGLQVLVSPARG